MAKDNNLNDFLRDLLDEIRAEYNINTLINPQDITEIIRHKGKDKKTYGDVTFFDTDGSVLYAYTWDEFRALDSLPELPRTEEYQGYPLVWSHTMEEILEQKNKCNVTCLAKDGYVAFLVSVVDNLTIKFSIQDTDRIRHIWWGDGTQSEPNIGDTFHTYEKPGVYLIQTFCNFLNVNYTSILSCPIIKFLGTYTGTKEETVPFQSLYIHRFAGKLRLQTQRNALAECSAPIINVEWNDNMKLGYSMIEELVINNTSTSGIISKNTFFHTQFVRIVIPEGIVEIKGDAFRYNDKLEKIYLPSTIQTVCLGAFTDCENLKAVDFSACTSVPSSVWDGVVNVKPLCSIVVPDALYDEWITTKNWTHIVDRIVKASEYTE